MTFDPKEARALVKRLDGYTPGPWDAALESGCHGVVAAILPEGANIVAVIGNDIATPEKEPSRFSNAKLMAAAPDLHASLTDALDEIERLTEALTLVERLYYLEDKDAGWRAARMNGVAREAQDGGDLGGYHRIFPRAALKGDDQ